MKKDSDKKIKILEEAVNIFARDGFEKASVDEICRKAGVAKGTVYYHFKGKEELFEAIINEGTKRFNETVSRDISGIDDPVKQLETIIKTEKKFILGYRNFFIIFMTQILTRNERFDIIEKVIENGMRSGHFKNTVSVREAATSFFWSVAVTTLNNQCHNQSEILLNGIKAGKTASITK